MAAIQPGLVGNGVIDPSPGSTGEQRGDAFSSSEVTMPRRMVIGGRRDMRGSDPLDTYRRQLPSSSVCL